MVFPNRFTPVAALIIFAGGIASTTNAAKTWVGGGASANINDATNWVGGVPLVNTNSANADVIFSGTTTNTVTMVNAFDYNPLWRNITFDATAGPFVFNRDSTPSGPTVTYDFHFNWSGAASVAATNNSPNTQTFNLDNIYLRKGKVNAAAGNFVFNGVLNIGANSASAFGINLDGAKDFYVNKGFVGNTATRLDKNGTGTVFLSESPVDLLTNVDNAATPTATGRWGGQLSVGNGAVEISHNFALGDTSPAGWTEIRSAVQGLGGTDQGRLVLTNNINSGEYIYLAGRPTLDPHIVNKSGTNTLSGTLVTESLPGNTNVTLQSDGTAAGDKLVVSGGLQQTSVDTTTLVLQGPGSGEITGPITEAGGVWNIAKNGDGTWKITSNNTYSGTTTINQGKLLINGTHSGGGDYTVNGGKLSGTGTIGSNVSIVGGTLAPGASVGTLNIGGNLSLTSGAFEWEFNSTALTADLTNVGGTLTINPAVTLLGVDFGSSILALGTKFTVLAYAGAAPGTFAGLADDSSFYMAGQIWRINYDDTSAGLNGGVASRFVTLTAVPEASSIFIMGFGSAIAIGAVWFGKRFGVAALRI